jgi:hypothetical protein
MTILRGSEKYLSTMQERERSQRQMSRVERLIERANAVSIFDVLVDYFNHDVPREGASYKSYCPFAYEHADGGFDKGFRTYPASNSSMCFPMHGYMPPVRLVSLKYGISQPRAAERILERYGLLRPRNYRARWSELMVAREQAKDQIGNPQNAVAALQTALEQTTDYRARQFDSDVSEAMSVVLTALDNIVASNDGDDLRLWHTKALEAMTKVIERNPRK